MSVSWRDNMSVSWRENSLSPGEGTCLSPGERRGNMFNAQLDKPLFTMWL